MSLYETTAAPVDPYAEQPYTAAPAPMETEPTPTAPRRSRSRSPRSNGEGFERPRGSQDRENVGSPAPRRPPHAPQGKAPEPSSVLGVFGLSIRTQERDLDEEFSKFGRVDKVTIVYDQRSDRSRGFGFIKMSSEEDATKCIEELNGVELHGRRLRVDYSVTSKPHQPTPGEYMGHRRNRDSHYGRRDRDGGDSRDRDRYRDRDSDRRDRDRDYSRRDRGDPYSRDGGGRDWRDRRSPPARGRYSPDYKRRRSYSRSPARGSSPPRRDAGPSGDSDDRRW